LGTNIPLNTLFSNNFSLGSSPYVDDNKSYILLNYLLCTLCVPCWTLPVLCARIFRSKTKTYTTCVN
jgi:hypothetical protein